MPRLVPGQRAAARPRQNPAEHGEEHLVQVKAEAPRGCRSRTGRKAGSAIITGVPRCADVLPLG
jgi:hypothetical protein